MKKTSITATLVIFSLFLNISCTDRLESEIKTEEDALVAQKLANEYFDDTSNTSSGRIANEWKNDPAITLLKYVDGQLLFSSMKDDSNGYVKVEETSVTAILEPGEPTFWYAGEGMKSLIAIEFDDQSNKALGEKPYAYKEGSFWVVTIPEDANEGLSLKYDISFSYEGSNDEIQYRIIDPVINVRKRD